MRWETVNVGQRRVEFVVRAEKGEKTPAALLPGVRDLPGDRL